MTTTIEPTPSVAAYPWDGAIFDGTFRAAANAITVTAAATGQVIGRVGQATASDLDRAVEQARTAQREWAALPYVARVAVMLKAAQLLEADSSRHRRGDRCAPGYPVYLVHRIHGCRKENRCGRRTAAKEGAPRTRGQQRPARDARCRRAGRCLGQASIPFGGTKASGVGGRFGGPSANLDTFTETQWVTMQAGIESYPF